MSPSVSPGILNDHFEMDFLSRNRASILYSAAGLLGGLPMFMSLTAVARPDQGLAMLDFTQPKDPEARKLSNSLVRLLALRELVMSLMTLAVWFRGDRKTLGWMIILATILPVTDGLVSLQQIGTGFLKHFMSAPIMAGLGTALLW